MPGIRDPAVIVAVRVPLFASCNGFFFFMLREHLGFFASSVLGGNKRMLLSRTMIFSKVKI